MSRYEATIDLNGGGKLFIKGVLLKRQGEYYELELMGNYERARRLSAEPYSYKPKEGLALMDTGPNCLGADTLMIMKAGKDRSLFVVLGTDEYEVQSYIDDFIRDCGEEMEDRMPKEFKEAINLYIVTNDARQKLEAGGAL